MKPVLVVWFDAVSEDSWQDLDDAKRLELHTIHSLGFLVSEDEKKIIIAASWDRDRDGVASHWAIPKTWLLSMKYLDIDV
jgi:hypothetical protein